MQTASNTQHEDSVGHPTLLHARAIPSLTHQEARAMATLELERFLAFITSLSPEDWEKPTACPLWNVQQMITQILEKQITLLPSISII